MENNYSIYKATDFVTDPLFYYWVISPTEESNQYWATVQDECPLLKGEMERAIEIIHHTRFHKSPLSASKRQLLKARIDEEIKQKKRKKLHIGYVWRAAACIAAFFILSTTVWTFFMKPVENFDYQQFAGVSPEMFLQDEIQLVLNDSSQIELKKNDALKYSQDQTLIVNDSVSQKETVLEQEKQVGGNEMAFNKLIVPRGRTSSIEFNDGTKVWINSGTVVVYPVEFKKDVREIYVEGEAYLEVAKNDQKPFIVKTPDYNVRVLGTGFNISSYRNEASQSVVLVHGSVEVQVLAQNKKIKLLPNEMLEVEEDRISKQMVDVNDYISWKEGYLIFHNEPLTHVMNRISRYYNVEVVYQKYEHKAHCSGKLNMNRDIDKVIESLEGVMSVEVQRKGNKLYVSNKPFD